MLSTMLVVSMPCCRHAVPCLTRRIPHTAFSTCKRRLSREVRHSKLKKFNTKLEFETDTTGLQKEKLLYSFYEKETTNVLYSIGAIVIGLCCLNSAHLTYTTMSKLKTPSIPTDTIWLLQKWHKLYTDYNIIPIGISLILVATGIVAFLVVHLNLSHQVRSITLLKGGDKIILEHYGVFGRVASRELKLSQVSAQVPKSNRTQSKDYFHIKVDREYFNYYIELKGNFPDEKLFYNTVGVQRTPAK